jgi:putative Mg2+ transporter-C (MgtC) family protein
MSDSLDQLEILGYVVLALVAGAAIGAEREAADKPAGLRTHMLVAAAAALFVGLGGRLIAGFAPFGDQIRSDPVRLIEALVTGVSFLGAGTILRRSGNHTVEGLTTAASLLVTSAIGAAVALRLFVLAAGVTVVTVATLRGLGWLERRWPRPQKSP